MVHVKMTMTLFIFGSGALQNAKQQSMTLSNFIRVVQETEWIKSQCALVYWPTMELDSLLCNYFNIRVIWHLVAIWHLDYKQSLIFLCITAH